MLRAFLLNAIKRNQASGKWEDFFALQSTGGVEWASFTRTSAVPKRTTCGGQDERIATDISTSAGFADHPRPYSPDGVGGSGLVVIANHKAGISELNRNFIKRLSEVYRNSSGTLSELYRNYIRGFRNYAGGCRNFYRTCIGTTSVGPA